MSSKTEQVPKDWTRTQLEMSPEVRKAFVDEMVALYKSNDVGLDGFLESMRMVIECRDEADRD